MNISYTFDWEEFVSKHKALQGFKSLDDAISEIEKKLGIQFMQLPDGTIYGAVLPDGTMYFNPEHLNANTPIHDMSRRGISRNKSRKGKYRKRSQSKRNFYGMR